MELKEKLVTLRKKKGLSQLELAEMVRVSRQAVSRWEVGSAIPSTNNLKYLSSLYDVPLDYLIHDNMPESICAATETEKKIDKEGKKRRLVLVLIVIGVVLTILLYTALFQKKSQEPVPMDNIEGSEVDTVSENDFELEW